MKFTVKKSSLVACAADALIVGVPAEAKQLPARVAELDKAMRGAIREALGYGDFKGEAEQTVWIPGTRTQAKRVLLVGLGKGSNLEAGTLRRAFAAGARACGQAGLQRVALSVPSSKALAADAAACAVAEGLSLSTYDPALHKTKANAKAKGAKAVSAVVIAEPEASAHAAIKGGVTRGLAMAAGTIFARDLVNEPANVLTPTRLADAARSLAKDADTITCKVWGPKDIEKNKMGGLMGVGRGSAEPSQFIQLEYKPKGARALRKIALVGKGLTFDTGGISIKPAAGMELMKFDMGGAAAVLGALKILGLLEPSVHVLGYIAATENMPDGKAIKPGDLLHMMNGMTVEVNNTDAEGRLVLADALHHAKSQNPEFIVDAATLTGACMIALGDVACGMMTEDDDLAQLIEQASASVDEPVWRLPLRERHRKLMEGHVADLKNTGPREGGALTAAGFLSYFAKGARWAHLDIAGMVWTEESSGDRAKGATGYGARLLAAIAEAAAR